MANTIVQADGPDGSTLTLKLYAVNGDTILNGASGDAMTEHTENLGTYTATVTQALTGVHEVRLTDASDNTIAKYVTDVLVNDTGTYKCHDVAGAVDANLSQSDLDAIIAGVQSVSDNIQQAQTGVLTGYQHSTWTASLVSLPALTGYDEIVFTLKRNKYDLDADAILKVSDTDGLQILNGVVVAGPNTLATITVNQTTPTGEVTLVVGSATMADVAPSSNYIDGFKKLDVGSDVVLRSGKTIIRDSGVDEVSP